MAEETFHHLAKHIAHVEQNVPSAALHSIPLGGRMAYYAKVHDSVKLVQAVKAACDIALPYLVIGQGTSTLIHDDGFPGLVIHNDSRNVAFSTEHSQMVVESGTPLQAAILQAAERGLGGLIHMYHCGGSVGGALYFNNKVGRQSIADMLRSLTVLMPPTKIKPEPTIVRFKGTWLTSKADEGLTRLQTLGAHAPRDYQPIILTAQLQLTSLRHDELSRRIQIASKTAKALEPKDPSFGPLFDPPVEETVDDLLIRSEVVRLKHPGLVVNKHYPNYCSVRGRYVREHGGTIPLDDFLQWVDRMKSQVYERTGVELQPSFLVH